MFDTVYETCLVIVTVLTIFIQLYVFYLIATKSPKPIKEYTYFLNRVLVADLAFTVFMGLFFQAYPLSPFLASAPRGLCTLISGNACNVTAAIAFYLGVCLIMFQFYSLLYRFLVILSKTKLHRLFMSIWCKCFFHVLGTFVAVLLTYLFYGMLVEPEMIPTHPGIRLSEVTVKLRPNETILIIDINRPITKLFAGVTTAGMIMTQIIAVVLVYAILSYLQKHSSSFNESTYRLHRQLTILLAAQIFIPVFFIAIPFLLYVVVALGGYGTNQFANEIGLFLLALYGLVNTLLTLVFVGPYRIHVHQTVIIPIRRFLSSACDISSISPNHTSAAPPLVISFVSITRQTQSI